MVRITPAQKCLLDAIRAGWELVETKDGYALRRVIGEKGGRVVRSYVPVRLNTVTSLIRANVLEYEDPEDEGNPYIRISPDDEACGQPDPAQMAIGYEN